MTIHALWVINKAGGLVFSRSYSDTLPPLPLNTILILAGTLHGIHAITSKLSPISSAAGSNGGSGRDISSEDGFVDGGMEAFEAENWGGKVFLTMTGTKFVILHSIAHPGLDETMRKVYEIYSDAVMKNPFHTPEMPINSSLFESRLQGLIGGINA